MSVYLLLLCVVLLQQEARAAGPEPAGCLSPEAVRVAEEALDQINRDRTSGYILGLNRLYDVSHTHVEAKGGTLYNLTMDVLETSCHLISRKPWKQCLTKDFADNLNRHDVVYGECEVSVFVDSQVKLHRYSCSGREVPPEVVLRDCPDCPTSSDLNSARVKMAAELTLKKFNEDGNMTNYFTLETITKARSQWVVGPSYFVEYVIVETVCPRETAASELSNCKPMDCQLAHRGLCEGTHMVVQMVPLEPVIQVKCEIYEPQAAVVEQQAHADAGSDHAGQHQQQHNHTHMHTHEHTHSATPNSEPPSGAGPQGPRGWMVGRPAPVRAPPAGESCPGPRTHKLRYLELEL